MTRYIKDINRLNKSDTGKIKSKIAIDFMPSKDIDAFKEW